MTAAGQPGQTGDIARPLAVRGAIIHCRSDPGDSSTGVGVEYLPDGLLLVDRGRVLRSGPAPELLRDLGEQWRVLDYSGKLIVPGFVDCHVHYPQTDMIASYGAQLLDWLEQYTFPTERHFEDAGHAREVADFFLTELLRNGTTTALVFGTVHPGSVEAFFAASARRNTRMVAGKVLMDRNAPDYLRDSPGTGYRDSKALIERWHGNGRQAYAVTPRFAPTSSEAQLEQVGRLAREHPDVYIHSHVAENRGEVDWVAELFPWSRSYLDVYDRYRLVRRRSVYAHCIHLDPQDRQRMSEMGAVAAFCPTSNLFLGSGLFDLQAADQCGLRVGLATDVGAGTSFSMLQTLNEAYKVLQMRGHSLSPYRGLYLATLGGARALDMDGVIGNFESGREADFVVLDPAATPLLARRLTGWSDPADLLFALMMLGDDRAVAATYVMGVLKHSRAEPVAA